VAEYDTKYYAGLKHYEVFFPHVEHCWCWSCHSSETTVFVLSSDIHSFFAMCFTFSI